MTKPWATIQQIDSTASMAQKGVTEPLFVISGLFFLFVQCLRGHSKMSRRLHLQDFHTVPYASIRSFMGRKTLIVHTFPST